MVLIGGYAVLNKSPGRWLAGSTLSANRSNWTTPGSVRNMWIGWGGLLFNQSYPCGYSPEYSIYDCPRVGGISSRNNADGSSSVSFANLAGGFNIDSSNLFSGSGRGSGNITNADGSMVIWTGAGRVSQLTGSGNVSAASLLATLAASANLTGTSSSTAALNAAVYLVAALTASTSISATSAAVLTAVASLTGSTTISGNCYALVLIAAALSGSSALTADDTAIAVIAAGLAASGNVAAAGRALGYLIGAVTASAATTGSPTAKAGMSAAVNVTGDLLSTANVGSAVWDFLMANNLSAEDLLKIVAAVAAGKTDINTSGPSPVVTFRDLLDTHDVVVATMTGSERSSVTLDP